MIIKAILLVGLAGLSLVIARARLTATHLALRRLSLGILIALGMLATVFPEAVTAVAQRLGVGRGTDLVLYLMVMSFLFVTISLYRRISDLEEKYRSVVRTIALQDTTEDHPPGVGS